jgi:hypothetical protein
MCYNADGTMNRLGQIMEYVEMQLTIDEHQELIHLAVTDLGKADLFLDYEWFVKHNPEIDWTKGEVRLERCPEECREVYFGEELEDEIKPIEKIEKEEQILMIDINSQWMQIQQRAFQTVSSRLVEEEERKKGKEEEFEKRVPKPYWSFRESVFRKESFDQLPEKRPWDHAIELVPGAKLKDCKIYPLS